MASGRCGGLIEHRWCPAPMHWPGLCVGVLLWPLLIASASASAAESSVNALSAGIMAFVDNDLEQAGLHLSHYLASYPEDAAARKLLAAVQLQLGQPRRAMEVLSSAHEQSEADAQRQAILGCVQLRVGLDLEGLAQLRLALSDKAGDLPTRLVLKPPLDAGAAAEAEASSVTVVELDRSVVCADLLKVLQLLQHEAFEQASALLAGYLEQQPQDGIYLYLLGRVYEAQDDAAHARAAYLRALQYRPELLLPHLGLGRLALNDERWSDAQTHYRTVLEARGNQIEALRGLTQAATRMGDAGPALTWLERAWRLRPSLPIGDLLIETLLAADRPGRALEVAKDLASRFADSPESLHSLGLALLANDQGSAALKVLGRLTERQPESVQAWQLLATARLQTQDFSGAMAALDRAIALDPDGLAARLIRAEIYLLSERYEEALNNAREIQQRAPNQAVGYKLEGDIHMQRQDYKSAEQAYQAAFEHDASAQSALLLNNVRWQAGRKEAALSALRRWLAILPEDTVVRLQLAMQLQQMERDEEAITEYERILEDQPNHIMVLNNLAWLYLRRDPHRSVAYAERAQALAPDRYEIADTLGWALVQAGELRRAVPVLQQAAVQAPHRPVIRYHLAVAQSRLDQTATALALLDELRDETLTSDLRNRVEALHRRLQSKATASR